MGPPATAYDRAITIFSPEGRLYQVMYASEAVKQGWTSLGLKTDEYVILAAEKRKIMKLLDLDSMEKIYKVDDHVGVTFAGIGGDGRILIDYARLVAARHRLVYGEPATVEYIVKAVADIKQMYTQHGGVRPFGVALIFGGVDEDGTTKLFRTEPGGQYFGYYAIAIGIGSDHANAFFEKSYKNNMSFEEALVTVLKALINSRVATSDEKRETILAELPSIVEIGYIQSKERTFKRLSREELIKFIEEHKKEIESS